MSLLLYYPLRDALFLTLVSRLAKDYPECMRSQLGKRLPEFSDTEFALLREAEVDFYGMNYYTAQYARHRTEPASVNDFMGNVDELQENKEGVSIGEESGVHWLRSSPHSFRKHLARIYHRYGRPIYVTENGCPCPGEDKMTREESVKDHYRIRYYETHLDAISLAIKEDSAIISGYFAWSLMDNLGKSISICRLQLKAHMDAEWSDGYGVRFGVTYTDYDTLERTPKLSALALKGLFETRMSGRV